MQPGKYIQGLPIPAAAAVLISLVVANTLTGKLPFTPLILSVLTLLLALFMVSSIPFRSFKDLRLSWRSALFIAVALGSTAVIAVRYHPSLAFVWLLSAYVVIGILEGLFTWMLKSRSGADEAERV